MKSPETKPNSHRAPKGLTLAAAGALSMAAAGCLPAHRTAPHPRAEASAASSAATTSTTVRSSPETSTTTTINLPRSIEPSFQANVGVPIAWINKVPSLQTMGRLFPSKFPDVQTQLKYIDWLEQQLKDVSVSDLLNFKISTQYENVFAKTQSGYNVDPRIIPQAFMEHWTAQDFPHSGMIGDILLMLANKVRVEFGIGRAGAAYQLFDSDTRAPAHAYGANGFTQGGEMEATGTTDLTPAEVKSGILLAVLLDLRNHLPVNRSTVVGHYAVNLIYNTPCYNRDKGTFWCYPDLSQMKIDPPQELVNFMADKASAIAVQLQQTQNGGNSNPLYSP